MIVKRLVIHFKAWVLYKTRINMEILIQVPSMLTPDLLPGFKKMDNQLVSRTPYN